MMEQEIDLRPYFWALLRGWKLILGVVLIAIIAAAGLMLLQPTAYQAEAQILVAPTTSQVSLDPRFETRDSSIATNAVYQRQALIDIATSPVLESRVANELGLSTALPGSLLSRIEVTSASDLITIVATDEDPAAAAALADAWARNYEQLVNELYTGVAAQSQQLSDQLVAAQERYDAAQSELEGFLSEGGTVGAFQEVQRLSSVLDVSSDAQEMLYTQYMSRTQELSLILEDARTLRAQASSDAALADSLASLSLRSRVAGGAQLPVELRFDNTDAFSQTREATQADLDQLIGVLEQERDRVAGEAEVLGVAVAAGDSSAVGLPMEARNSYERDLAAAQSRLEQLQARERLLTQRRDIAFTSLEVLQRRSDELLLAQVTPEISVRYAGSGIPQQASRARGLVISAILAGGFAFVLSAAVVLALTVWRGVRSEASARAATPAAQSDLAAEQRPSTR
jgi:capsular polysaccharide biosynthesis protein